MQKYLNTYRDMISLRGLTNHTIKSYSTYLSSYLDYLKTNLHKLPEEVSWQDLRDYIAFIQAERNLSDRTMNACISQLRFFTLYVLHKPWDPYQLPMRKFDSYLPFVPSKEEVLTFISTLPDLKQKAMVSLLYSAGLRIGEVCHLQYKDIDRKNMRIHISHGKNRSDRYAVLSTQALTILTDYWFAYDKPMHWLFPKQFKHSEKPIDTYYLSWHIHAHEKTLGWEPRLTCHSFRHAFGTHLYENGTDLLTIKALLGHKSLNSTTIYVQLASNGIGRAISPFDYLEDSIHA
jgi:integrase/recombinase XerD